MNVERTTDPQGGVVYNFGPNNIIQRPAWPTAMDASEPANFTEYAVEAYGSYLDFIKKIAADESLINLNSLAKRLTIRPHQRRAQGNPVAATPGSTSASKRPSAGGTDSWPRPKLSGGPSSPALSRRTKPLG